ncbi:hypothetical protein SAMN04488243_1663 [Thermus arciformis]|uniref:Uncharacterized protein n=1 Tax=Thermus arciformis TaxID=482827 RepID=A0A1G7LH58_9DEIN|nr:hypothetical protein [Thermus arciformis]SDF48805.1 hypothetical protein SAMN04488243_1663 [Thermus arciformis]
MWTRRRVLALLLLSPWARADEHRKEEEKEEKKAKKEGRSTPFYGQVEGVAEEGLWVAGRWVRPGGDLWRYFAPGMVVAVEGERVRVVEPRTWAYLQGPGAWAGLPGAWVRVWWAEGRLWKSMKGASEEALVVARAAKGRWLGVPPSFRLLPAPQEGWWRLRLEGGEWRPQSLLAE